MRHDVRRIFVYVIVGAIVLSLVIVTPKVVRKVSEAARRAQLTPSTQAVLDQLQSAASTKGIATYLGETYRSLSDQQKKVSEGLSSPATEKGGWHQTRRAFHLYPVVNGQPDIKVTNEGLLRQLVALAESLGIKSLAYNSDGTRRQIKTVKGYVWDANHFEYHEGLTLAQALQRVSDQA